MRRALPIGLLAFAFRFLTLSPLENDHFVMLARAQQVLFGDWTFGLGPSAPTSSSSWDYIRWGVIPEPATMSAPASARARQA